MSGTIDSRVSLTRVSRNLVLRTSTITKNISATAGRGALIYATVYAASAHANILGLFPAGPGCKSAAMETAGDCGEAQTLLYNPAVMSVIPAGFAGELGVARMQYSYEHPSFDPVHVNLISPMFSEGWKGALADGRGAWGFAVMPSSVADLNIKGLPRRVSGTVESLNVHATRKQFHIPIGGSYLFPESSTSVGASLIYTYEHRTLKGASVTNPGTNLVDTNISGHFFRPVFGTHWTGERTAAGAAYMMPLKKSFKGRAKLATEAETRNTNQVDYDPAVALVSGRVNLAPFTLSANVNRVFAAQGQSIPRDDTNKKTNKADLKDANHVGVRAGYEDSTLGEFSVAAAYLDSYWGDGSYYTDADGFAHHEFGQLFGQFNAIPVRNQSITWKSKPGSWQTHASIYRSAGSTTVGPGGDNPGYYQIEFIAVTCGLRRSL